MIIHARHYGTGQPIAATIERGRIDSISPSNQNPTQWIAPAFFDPQINGCLGIAFNSPELRIEQVRTVVEECLKHGIGGICPTLIPNVFLRVSAARAVLGRQIRPFEVVAGKSAAQFRIGFHGPRERREPVPQGFKRTGDQRGAHAPDAVFQATERHAQRTRKSRSQLYAEAVTEYLNRHAPHEVTG